MRDQTGNNSYSLSSFGLAPGNQETCDRVVWANNWQNCKPQYITSPEILSGHINPLPDRYKIADVRPLQNFVNMRVGALPNPYDPKIFYGRVALEQMRWLDIRNGSNNNRNKDRYQRFLNSPEEAFAIQQCKNQGRVPMYNKI